MKNNLKLEDIKNFKLCYVENRRAFFTNKDFKEQWGDDWDDAPYEHNAGYPYEDGVYKIISLYFYADLNEPNFSYINSPYSVEDINNGAIAWLSSPSYNNNKVYIQAGTTVKEFIEKIQSIEGEIFLPFNLIKNVEK